MLFEQTTIFFCGVYSVIAFYISVLAGDALVTLGSLYLGYCISA